MFFFSGLVDEGVDMGSIDLFCRKDSEVLFGVVFYVISSSLKR